MVRENILKPKTPNVPFHPIAKVRTMTRRVASKNPFNLAGIRKFGYPITQPEDESHNESYK